MKNPAPYLRKAFFDLLDGQVEYNSVIVPVKEQGGSRVVPYMILLGEFTNSDRSNKHSFTGRASQLISIVHEGAGTVYHEDVDAIGDQVMNLIQPSPREIGINVDEFQIIGLVKDSQNYLDERSASGGFVTRLLLRYSFLVNQINLVQTS